MTSTQKTSANSGPDEHGDGEGCMDDFPYPKGVRLALLLLSVYISFFLVALDKLIISTAIPAITDEFHSENDIGWYGTAYLLTNCAFLLVFGKIYTFINVKATFITALLLFEAGSAVCGAAPNSTTFIVGRAIAGLGAGGIQAGVVTIIVYAVPLAQRPQYQGLLGAMYGISSILGPLVGGAFTTNVTWRWCFYLNLPLGGLVLVFVVLILRVPGQSRKIGLMSVLTQLNLEGIVCLLPGIICLCLALQWGGFAYDWSDGRIVALLVVACVLIAAFTFVQYLRPDVALVPPRIFCQRSIFGGFWVSSLVGSHNTLFVYFLPIWFQVVKGNSAVESGVHLLPLVLSLVLFSIITGAGTTLTGFYMPFLIFGICVASIGAGLLTTLQVDTTIGKWIGYQILYGAGIGCCFQAPNVAAQTVLHRREVSIGASLMLFAQTLFGAVFVSVGQNVLDGDLAKRVKSVAGLTPEQINRAGITGIFDLVPKTYRARLLDDFNSALRSVFTVALALACLTILGSVFMEWLNVKREQQDERGAVTPKSDANKGECG